MSLGKLKVRVVCGRELQNKETFQSSDPYCKIEVGNQTHKTKHIDNTLNPDWNEEFEFDVQHGIDIVSLSLWDKNTFKKDVFMGYSFVTFDDCFKDEPKEKTAAILGGCSGDVCLIVTPNFETSASKIVHLNNQVNHLQVERGEDEALKKHADELLQAQKKLNIENEQLEKEIENLKLSIAQKDQENKDISESLVVSRKDLDERENMLKSLKENNDTLTKEIENLKKKIEMLSENQTQIEEQIQSIEANDLESTPHDPIFEKLKTENEKLFELKENLTKTLMGFQTVQALIFHQLNKQIDEKDFKINSVKEKIVGFEKLQEMVFKQLNRTMQTFDMSVLKSIEESLSTN